jgi:hypothetical protein
MKQIINNTAVLKIVTAGIYVNFALVVSWDMTFAVTKKRSGLFE